MFSCHDQWPQPDLLWQIITQRAPVRAKKEINFCEDKDEDSEEVVMGRRMEPLITEEKRYYWT